MSLASPVEKLEKYYLPDHAVFETVLHVRTNSGRVRKKVVRRGRFAFITPHLDKYEVEERISLPPYLCIVKYGISRSDMEVVGSLPGTHFQAATLGRFFDLCREYPEKQFGYRIVFLGTSWWLGSNIGFASYPSLRETADGARIFSSVLSRNRFRAGWRFALQPISREVAELLKEIVENNKRYSVTDWISGGARV